MLPRCLRAAAKTVSTARTMATATFDYPYSKVAIIPSAPKDPPPPALLRGKGLMAYLQQTLPSSEKMQWMTTYFARNHPDRLRPGSVLTVTLAHAPTTFSGVLISVRRRGPDTSFVLRNVVQRTGVEMQFFVNSPHVKEIKVVSRTGRGEVDKSKRTKKAKLFFLRDSPKKMTAIAAGARR